LNSPIPATNNVYGAPGADLGHVDNSGDTYEPQFFSMGGRIGRVRYIAYMIGVTFLSGIAAMILAALFGGIFAAMSIKSVGLIIALMVVAYIPMLFAMFVVMIRRLNDMDQSGWLSILTLIPIVGFFVSLWMLFARGSEGSNKYGQAPTENSTAVVVVAWVLGVFGIIFFIGIMAAVSIPAYQDYVRKAKAAQQQQSSVQAPLVALADVRLTALRVV
jgi:uncharacterized membrane protein YhaH (DUF805 family)